MTRVACLVFLLLALSCREAFTPQTGPEVAAGPPLRVLPTIRVLDPGMPPLRPIRYAVPSGQVERLHVELAMARAVQKGAQGTASGLPPVQLEVRIGPAEPTQRTWVRQPVQITKVRVGESAEGLSPPAREHLERQLAPLFRIRGWSEMDDQGRIRRSDFQAIGDVSPRLRAMLGNIRTALISIPFPDEPIGLRARWEVERRFEVSGVFVDQVVTYNLLERQGESLRLQITARQSAQPQSVDGARLEAYESSVIGSSTVRLDYFVPFSEAEATTRMRLTEATEGEPTRVETRTAVRVYPLGDSESDRGAGSGSGGGRE